MEEVALSVLLLLVIWGTVADVRYLRNGGVRPVFRDFIAVGSIVVLLPLLVSFSTVVNGYPILPWSETVKFGAVLICTFWKLDRWRVRHKYPHW